MVREATPEEYDTFFANQNVIDQLNEGRIEVPDLNLIDRVREGTSGLSDRVGRVQSLVNKYGPTVIGGAVVAAGFDAALDTVALSTYVESGITAGAVVGYVVKVARPIHQLGFRNYAIDRVRSVPALSSRVYSLGKKVRSFLGEAHRDWPLVYSGSSKVAKHKRGLKKSWFRTALIGLATVGYIGMGLGENTADAALRLALIDDDQIVRVDEPETVVIEPDRVPDRIPVKGGHVVPSSVSLAATIAEYWVNSSNVDDMKDKMEVRQWSSVGASCGAWTGLVINEIRGNTGKDLEKYCPASHRTLGDVVAQWQMPFVYNIDNDKNSDLGQTHSSIFLGVGKSAYDEYRAEFSRIGETEIVKAIDRVKDIEDGEALVVSFSGSDSVNFGTIPLGQKPTYNRHGRDELRWPVLHVKPFLTDDTYELGCGESMVVPVVEDGPGLLSRGWDWVSGLVTSVDVTDSSLRMPFEKIPNEVLEYGEEHKKGESISLSYLSAVDVMPSDVDGPIWITASFDGTAKRLNNHSSGKEHGKCLTITSEDGQDKDYLCNVVPQKYGAVKAGERVAFVREGEFLHRELKVDGKSISGGLIINSSEDIYENQLEAILGKYGPL